MTTHVSAAKLKINQQAEYITKLEQQLKILHTTSSSRRPVEQPPRESKPALPLQQTPTTKSVHDGTTEESKVFLGGCGLDKTGPSLFESPTVLITSTPSVGERHRQVIDTPARLSSRNHLLQETEASTELKNPERLETVVELDGEWTERNADSDATSGDSMDTSLSDNSEAVIYIGDDGYNGGKQEGQSRSKDKDANPSYPRHLSGKFVEKDEFIGNQDEDCVEEGINNSEEDLIAHVPQTCVSLFDPSIRTSPRPLRLRTTNVRTKKIKYKETEKSANVSSSTTSSSTSFERVPQSEAKDETSPSILEEAELISPSSSLGSNSPPFLCPTSSPFKTRLSSSPVSFKSPSNVCDRSGGASMSMFPSTPTVQGETTNDSREESSLKCLSTSHQNVPIPQSDSQFSLDVSQSMPLSPELCGGSFKASSMNTPKGNDRALSGNGQEMLGVPLTQRGSSERLTNYYGADVHSKDGQLKHTKLFSTPGGKGSTEIHGRANCISADVILKTPSIALTTVVPVTPGVTTVDKILSRPMNWGVPNQTVLSNYYKKVNNFEVKVHRGKRTKRHILDNGDEEIVPARKKQNFTSQAEPEPGRLETYGKQAPSYINTSEELHECDREPSPVLEQTISWEFPKEEAVKDESGLMGRNSTISERAQENDQKTLVCIV